MINKCSAEITLADIESLIENRIPEGLTLEYKESYPDEIASYITAFANSSGGDLILGLKEARDQQGTKLGYPSEVVGVEQPFELVKSKIESQTSDTVHPRLPPLEIVKIGEGKKGDVILVRISRSKTRPHIVSRSGGMRCFKRNTMGKFQLGSQELREFILNSQSTIQMFEQFVDSRIKTYVNGVGELTKSLPAMVVHLSSTRALELDLSYTPHDYLKNEKHFQIPELQAVDTYVNADGIIRIHTKEDWVDNSILFTWQGHAEFVNTSSFRENEHKRSELRPKMAFKKTGIFLDQSMKLLNQLGQGNDFVCSMSLLNCEASYLLDNPTRSFKHRFIRTPTVEITVSDSIPEIMKKIRICCERILYSGGLLDTRQYYDDVGNYTGS